MFYSVTYLARKGPLGTVWSAAHLQNRLKKSHYTSTDIPKTVEYIMYPEVPIALRMSGHLLLGVVRIYSKKVDYLFKDCNSVLTGLSKLFSLPMDLNLPEEALQAPAHSITLPQTLELDAVDLGDSHDSRSSEDSHTKSHEEITLADQVPGVAEPFVAITFDEDNFGTPQSKERRNSGVRLMDEAELNIGVEENEPPFRDPGPSHQSEEHHGSPQEEAPAGAVQEGSSMNNVPEFEVMRDAGAELRPGSPFNVPFPLDATMEEVRTEPIMNEQETPPPAMKEFTTPGVDSPVLRQHSGQQSSGSMPEAPADFDVDNSFGPNLEIRSSPRLEIQPSPPPLEIRPSPQAEQPLPPRGRKRKQFFDGAVVLTNRFMRRALNDSSDIRRKRKPNSSLLDLWKLNKRLRKEQVFDHPLITGMSEDLLAVSNKDYMSTKACSIPSAEAVPDPMVTEDNTVPFAEESVPDPTVANSPVRDQGADTGTEQLRQREESYSGTEAFRELMPSPLRDEPSTSRRSEYTPFSDNDTVLLSEVPSRATLRSCGQSSGMSSGRFGSDLETPLTNSGGEYSLGENRLSDIHELDTVEEELNFLETDDDASPSGSCIGQGGNSLSVRTRAVAEYLKRQSPTAPIAEGQSENLSLNKILEGKKKKLCARMFYETLVLKSYGQVDVQQEEPYGDISLRLAPPSSKAQQS